MTGFAIYASSSRPERAVLAALVEARKQQSFAAPSQATDAEAFGLLMADYFEHDDRILLAAAAALEDANFHTEAGQITEMHAAIMAADEDAPYDDSMRKALFAKLRDVYGPLARPSRLAKLSTLAGRPVLSMSCARSLQPVTVGEFRKVMAILDTLSK